VFGGKTGEVTHAEYSNEAWLLADSVWTRFPAQGPPARESFNMVYDHARNKTVLFSGSAIGGVPADTWEWDGVHWEEITGFQTVPESRMDHAMAFDRTTSRIVLYGGYFQKNSVGTDTWEYDGMDWYLKSPESSLPQLYGHKMAFDSQTGSVLLFGGVSSPEDYPLNDIWKWQGTEWELLVPETTKPPSRLNHAMAYDEYRERLVVFGGWVNPGMDDNTWEWDGADWHKMEPATTKPPGRYDHAMTYDSERFRSVMSGGYGEEGVLNDVWEWDGNDWYPVTILSETPPARCGQAMVYDPDQKSVMLFGGGGPGTVKFMGDTWEFRAVPEPTSTPTPIHSHTPTVTPTYTPSITPTETLTPVPTNTPTITLTPTPVPTDVPVTRVLLWMPAHTFKPGDACSCRVFVHNEENEFLFEYPLFVILDVYGTLFYAPALAQTLDYYLPLHFPPGQTVFNVVPSFQWPTGAGEATGIYWYAALTNPEITAIFGEWDDWEFGWHE